MIKHRIVILTLAFGLVSSAHGTQSDPWEKFNRKVFSVNEALDQVVLKPTAKAYQWVAPTPVDKGVSNFFSNLNEVNNVANNLLQFKIGDAANDTGRFVLNSTVGIFGLFDVASKGCAKKDPVICLPKHKEDFGQTLGAWGVPSGPYLMLPLLGPSTVRDGIAIYPDSLVHPLTYLPEEDWVRWSLKGLEIIDSRADLLAMEAMLTGDRYVAMRELYLQLRNYDVNDGVVDDPFVDDSSFEDDELLDF